LQSFLVIELLNKPALKISFKYIALSALTALMIVGCSRKKDKFVNRAWHGVGTKFNILYNGNIALEKGRQTLNDKYTDNYWEILPVERMQVTEEIALPGQSKNADFERAEEKAVKAIQKHSMNIKGKEKNPQIDDAYLLLGKARYFDQRFIPALESFNYILYKYPASNNINLAKVWREKTNLRLENDDLAIQNLKRLLEQEDLEDQDLADATSTLAQAYINTKSLDSAITQLEIAAAATKSDDERGRYRFIQGQLYNALGKKDSANFAFDKVIELNRNTPRIYMISAEIEKAKNFDYDSGDKVAFHELLTDLEENRENRPFLDKIYRQIGEYHRYNASDSTAKVYYKKSLRTNSRDTYLKALNYETIGNMSFDSAEYRSAGAYYDSTMLSLEKNSKFYRSVKRKRDNLEDVIRYEDIAQRNDSILRLVNLSDADRLVFFEAHTAKLKEAAEKRKALRELAEAKKRNSGGSGNSSTIGGRERSKTFYFYNQTTVSYGKNEFVQTWGERQLSDDWRWSSKNAISAAGQEIDEAIANASEDELFDPKFYIDRIPTEQTAIDSLSKDRNFAYYQLGLIYKDKFKEYNLAKDKLTTLLDHNPEERLVLPSKYNLYKLYQLLGQEGEAEIMKQNIIKNHPDSRYAAILLNPNQDLGADENSPEFIYEKLYRQFEGQEYMTVIAECDKYITLFDGEAIVPKFEFLKAVSKARIYGYESYKEAINFIALNYPNSPEGKKAEEMMQKVMPALAKSEFIEDNLANNFKVIYQFVDATDEDLEAFKTELEDAVKDVQYFDLTTSKDIYNNNTTFIVVHGLKSIDGALGFAEILKDNEKTIEKEYFAISSQNYQIVQIHKNLEAYLKSQ
jgi:tetratricopeptide (TPR) repeat protein